jgi:hypothetical protein
MMLIPQHRSDKNEPSTRSPPFPSTSHDYGNNPDEKTYACQDDERGQCGHNQFRGNVKGDRNNEDEDGPAD